MARNGSGVYSLPAGSTVTNGDTSDATDINTPLADIETDLNTARPVVAGGTGATSASAARTNLGLVIGTDVQAYSADLATYASNPLTAAELGELQNIGTTTIDATQWGYLGAITAAGAALIDDASASAQRTTLGLGTAAVAALLDEDDMASDSATGVPSQQSVKAYVDGLTGGFTSTGQTISAGTLATVAHGLGASPRHITLWIKCTDAGGDVGYSQNDEVLVSSSSSSSSVNRDCGIYRDATNVYVRFPASASAFIIGNKSTGASAGIDDTKWELIIEANI